MTEQEILALPDNPFARWREAAGLVQRQVALRLGVRAALVSAWERAVCAPTEAYWVPLCHLYQITPDELMAGRRWVWEHRPRKPDQSGHPLRG